MKKHYRITKFRTKRMWLIAAVFAGIMIGTGFFAHNMKQKNDQCQLSPEVEAICDHYENIMDQEIKHLEVILSDVDPSIRTKVLNDVEGMKFDTKELLKQFYSGVNNEQAITIIKTNYELKIKSVQFISSVFENNFAPPLT